MKSGWGFSSNRKSFVWVYHSKDFLLYPIRKERFTAYPIWPLFGTGWLSFWCGIGNGLALAFDILWYSGSVVTILHVKVCVSVCTSLCTVAVGQANVRRHPVFDHHRKHDDFNRQTRLFCRKGRKIAKTPTYRTHRYARGSKGSLDPYQLTSTFSPRAAGERLKFKPAWRKQ